MIKKFCVGEIELWIGKSGDARRKTQGILAFTNVTDLA